MLYIETYYINLGKTSRTYSSMCHDPTPIHIISMLVKPFVSLEGDLGGQRHGHRQVTVECPCVKLHTYKREAAKKS